MNNVYVSSYNHGFDPRQYIDGIPADRVVQVHLAGHTNQGTHILDTHSGRAIPQVWKLYERLVARTGPVSTLFEWDASIPPLAAVVREAAKARRYRDLRARHGNRWRLSWRWAACSDGCRP